jgi:7-keto-8-aminopelargonate synthetase-like enzyme
VAQALAGRFSHALIDERAHVSLTDAALWLDCPILKFKHRNVEDFARTLLRCGRGARLIVLTDGMFSHDGSVAPLRAYLKLLPRDGLLLVDDAHGAGTLGKGGGGTVELEGVRRARVVQCVTLSKAFGVYGGAVVCSRKMREQIVARSHLFAGSTPLPLPLAHAASVALRVVKSDVTLGMRLKRNADYVKDKLRRLGFAAPEVPGPVLALQFKRTQTTKRLQRALLRAGILPPFINYPGGPATGYFRFAISSEHTGQQLDNLLQALTPLVPHAAPTV